MENNSELLEKAIKEAAKALCMAYRGDDSEFSDINYEEAKDFPNDWCVECHGYKIAALKAARIAVMSAMAVILNPNV